MSAIRTVQFVPTNIAITLTKILPVPYVQ